MLIHQKVTAPAFHQASPTILRYPFILLGGEGQYPFILLGGEGQYPFILLGGERDTVKVNNFTQEHNRMTQLGLEPRPPRPGIHCTNHYATATKAPLPPSPPTPSPLVPSLLMFRLFRLLFLYIRFIVSFRTKTFLRDKLIF